MQKIDPRNTSRSDLVRQSVGRQVEKTGERAPKPFVTLPGKKA